MKTHYQYIAPTVKVVSFRVEDGFQSLKLSQPTIIDENYNANNHQLWETDGGSLFGNSNDWNN